QYFAARQDIEGLRLLADHVIDRHYPDAREDQRPYLALLDAVIDAQASLVARWKLIGFIHGVMNTDNTSICGETIDYGPCALWILITRARFIAQLITAGAMPMPIRRRSRTGILQVLPRR
ncbi:MAG: protein adenylyltransferase SelO family protein, partial [Arenicellales bacterium]